MYPPFKVRVGGIFGVSVAVPLSIFTVQGTHLAVS